MRLHKNGTIITSLEDWKRRAPPKSEDQWVEGRSAFEMARLWCGTGVPVVPAELHTLLESRSETRGLVLDELIPEHRIVFDVHGGEPRNADLAIVGHTSSAKVAMTIEAKADEPFGATVKQTLANALERGIQNPKSRGVRRVEDLVRALLPPRSEGLPHAGELRYQLLTAAAGTLAYAAMEGASLAVLIVHEFVTGRTHDKRLAQNAADYERFLQRLGGGLTSSAQSLVGPFVVPDTSPFRGAPLLIGSRSSVMSTSLGLVFSKDSRTFAAGPGASSGPSRAWYESCQSRPRVSAHVAPTRRLVGKERVRVDNLFVMALQQERQFPSSAV
jgi:Domain of unknown function (DUF6946)